jgi:CheY-like chemotaxis protein
MTMRSPKPILLVEDDRVDVMTVKRALKDLKVTNRLDVVGNGEETLEFLGGGSYPVELAQEFSPPGGGGLG